MGNSGEKCKHNMACPPRYFGELCNTSCPLGSFGEKCGGTCSPKCIDEYCDPVEGCLFNIGITTQRTMSTCAPGYSGQFCNESCSSGNSGDNCETSCYPECTDILCVHVAGCQNTNYTITTTGTTTEKKPDSKIRIDLRRATGCKQVM